MFTDIKTADLVAAYNTYAPTPVKKFSDRKTAEARLAALATELGKEWAVQEGQLTLVDKAPKAPVFRGIYKPTDRIFVNETKNPKKFGGGAYARFALYRDGMTIAEALDLGLKRRDITWDAHQRGHIIVVGENGVYPLADGKLAVGRTPAATEHLK